MPLYILFYTHAFPFSGPLVFEMAEGGRDYLYGRGRPSRPWRGRGSHRGRRARSRSRERADLPEDVAARNAQRMGQGNYSGQPHLRAPLLSVEDIRPGGGPGLGRGGYNHGRRGGGGHRASAKGSTPCDSGWLYEDFYDLAKLAPDALVRHLFENQAKLKFFLKRLNKIHPKLFGSIVHVLDKIVRSEEREFAGILMAVFFDPNEAGSLWGHATLAIKKMPQEASQDFRDKNRDILKKLCSIFQAALERIPQTSAYSLPLGDLKFALMLLSKDAPRQYSNLLQQVSELEHYRMRAISQPSHALEKEVTVAPKTREEPFPFGNFRNVPVLPTGNELDYKGGKVNQEVRANKKSGRYINWDHYLDVHFRLLREDFVFPLREGMKLYISESKQRNTSVRVYTGVHILEPVCLMTGLGFQLKFDVSRLHRVNWDHSKRLIFGALLCLSTDKFQSIQFATVVNRDSKQLEKGSVTVKFEDHTDGFRIDPSQEFVMLESSAYFEAYCHVLKKLQEINVDLMPFAKYLVECDHTAIQLPLYLQATENTGFDLHDSLGIDRRSQTGRFVDIARPESWPSSEVTHFDPTQMKAMQMALSQDLSIIQGPPGTGKTYVGTRIVEALLRNKVKWSKDASNPILIVCYTNHALDQFLEFIQGLVIGGTNPCIIRIGGRARSERMKACSLQAARQTARDTRSISPAIYKPVSEMTARIFAMKAVLEEITMKAPSEEDKLLPYQSILRYIKWEHRLQLESRWLQYDSRDQGRELEIWLDLWFPTPREPPSQEELAKQLEEELAIQEHTHTQSRASVEHAQNATHQGLQAVTMSHQENDAETVQVDEEARLAQDERLMEGEEILLPERPGKGHTQEDIESTSSKQEFQSHATASEFGWKVQQLKPAEKKKRIADGMKHQAMSSREAQRVKDIWKLHKRDKWRLYQHWAQEFIRNTKTTAQVFATEYEEICRERERRQHELDFHLLQQADIVGMTTTGAAKYNYILQRLSPKIVVIEEAAEVLESHIISCLSSAAQQLVLIGDHKQLRPKPNTHELVKDYHMAISLFERLAHNRFPLVTLGIQHRMRPEIACLVRPHIYEELEDHSSVMHYPSISGVGRNLFFLSHQTQEDTKDDDDLLSYSNQFEADFIVALCRYLLKQGQYEHHQITVLTMYKGQLLKLKRKMPITEFKGVRVAAVDDFQGEENDIILLSLVRSNDNGNVGFLREANRVCVALSRAKWALYVVGNFEMLRQTDGTPWPGIIEDVEKRGFLGNAMPLFCSNHPSTKTLVSSAADFTKVPEGGCSKPCGIRLRCGHVCPRTCHVADKEHANVPCMKSCEKQLPCGHKCRGRCYECSKGCKLCSEPVTKLLPCGHQEVLPCYKSPRDHNCLKACLKPLPCGHTCQKRCSEPCVVKCPINVRRILGCGHSQKVPCSIAPSDFKCQEQCATLLECGHSCPGTCSKCAGGRLHQPCSHPCERNLACGHVCNFPCTNACPPCEQGCSNYCNHSKCPKKCKEPCAPCMEQCQWQCEHHQCHKKCGDMCDRPRCDQPCKKKIKCGHPCIGLCGEECPTLCRICNKDEVCEIFFGTEEDDDARFIQLKDCKHVLEVSGLDQWMDMNDSDSPKDVEIQFKTCPKCKTPIRRSLRYGNIIKKSLGLMEMVKCKVLRGQTGAVDIVHLLTQFRELRPKLHGNLHYPVIRQHLINTKDRTKAVVEDRRHTTAHHEKAGLQTKFQVLKALGDLLTRLGTQPTTTTFMIGSTPLKSKEMLDEMQPVLHYAMQHDYFSAQQLSDIETELKRLSLLTSWCEIAYKMQHGESHRVTPAEVTQLVKLLTYLRCAGIGAKAEKLTESYHDGIKKLFDSLKKRCGVLGISDDERVMIVKAMGLTQGHWFKCPNGHVYCITECGGATVESKCPDCKATIGGTSHHLRDDNRLAPEMDGARHAAFSEAANLLNFDPALFR